jgi:MFS family permease
MNWPYRERAGARPPPHHRLTSGIGVSPFKRVAELRSFIVHANAARRLLLNYGQLRASSTESLPRTGGTTRALQPAIGKSAAGRRVPIFGLVVGRLIANNLSWRWVFYVNVPICLATHAASVAVLFLAGLCVYGPLLLLSLWYQDIQGKAPL